MGFFDDPLGNLFGKEKRTFSRNVRKDLIKQQNKKCACGRPINISNSQGDHTLPHSAGGPDADWNRWQRCDYCHKRKTETEAGVYDDRKRDLLSWKQNEKDMNYRTSPEPAKKKSKPKDPFKLDFDFKI